MTTTCRSSAGCIEPAGHGLWQRFCPQHAEELAAVRTRWYGSDVVADAVAVAHAVLGAGRVKRAELSRPLAHLSSPQITKAVEVAQAQDWITSTRSTPLAAGANLPPGLSVELRALVLAQDVHDGGDPPALVAADVLALGVDRGWLTPDLERGAVKPVVELRWSLRKRDRKTPRARPAVAAKPSPRARADREAQIVELVRVNGHMSGLPETVAA